MVWGCNDTLGRTYAFGDSKQAAAYGDLGKALQRALARDQTLQLKSLYTAGSMENLQRLRDRTLDFGLVQGGYALDDAGLKSVASVSLEFLHIIVPAASDIRTFRDLAGKRVTTGLPGSGSRPVVEAIVAASSLDPPIILLEATPDAFEQVLDAGKADAAMYVTSLRRELTPRLNDGRYRLIGISQAEALAVDLFDAGVARIPSGSYGANLTIPPEPLPTLFVDTNIIVRADVPDHVVRKLTEALFSHQVQIEARMPRLKESTARAEADLDLHPGAAAYYARNDPLTADQFEIVGVGLAALLAIIGAIRFGFQWWKARQHAVDREAIGDVLLALQRLAGSGDASTAAGKSPISLLNEALERWMQGRIDDEELRLVLDAIMVYSLDVRPGQESPPATSPPTS
jgi:TRAP transporter TAXI family solute receptor